MSFTVNNLDEVFKLLCAKVILLEFYGVERGYLGANSLDNLSVVESFGAGIFFDVQIRVVEAMKYLVIKLDQEFLSIRLILPDLLIACMVYES